MKLGIYSLASLLGAVVVPLPRAGGGGGGGGGIVRDVMGRRGDYHLESAKLVFVKFEVVPLLRSGNATKLDVLKVAWKKMPAEADLDGY